MRGHSHYLLHYDAMGVTIIIPSKKILSTAESTRLHPRDSIRKNCEALIRCLWFQDMTCQSLGIAFVSLTKSKLWDLPPFTGRLCGELRPLDTCFGFVRTTSTQARVIPSTDAFNCWRPPAKGKGAGCLVDSGSAGQLHSSTQHSIHQSRRWRRSTHHLYH